jgi:hypothetical protein
MIINNKRQKDDHKPHQPDEHMRGNFKQKDESYNKKINKKKMKRQRGSQ